jgi:hypothetical protein
MAFIFRGSRPPKTITGASLDGLRRHIVREVLSTKDGYLFEQTIGVNHFGVDCTNNKINVDVFTNGIFTTKVNVASLEEAKCFIKAYE